jgi:hypothetical protein
VVGLGAGLGAGFGAGAGLGAGAGFGAGAGAGAGVGAGLGAGAWWTGTRTVGVVGLTGAWRTGAGRTLLTAVGAEAAGVLATRVRLRARWAGWRRGGALRGVAGRRWSATVAAVAVVAATDAPAAPAGSG